MPGVFITQRAEHHAHRVVPVAVSTSRPTLVVLLTLIVASQVMTLPVWISGALTLVLIGGWITLAIVEFGGGHVQNIVYPLARCCWPSSAARCALRDRDPTPPPGLGAIRQ